MSAGGERTLLLALAGAVIVGLATPGWVGRRVALREGPLVTEYLPVPELIPAGLDPGPEAAFCISPGRRAALPPCVAPLVRRIWLLAGKGRGAVIEADVRKRAIIFRGTPEWVASVKDAVALLERLQATGEALPNTPNHTEVSQGR